MAIEINIPKLGLTMKEARLVKWAAGLGEKILLEQIVLVLETDKISYEMPSPGEGLLHPLVEPDSEVMVGQLVGYLAVNEAELNQLAQTHPPASVKHAAPAIIAASISTASISVPSPSATAGRMTASPLARSMAKTHGLDLSKIVGSGPAGRILRADVLRSLETRPVSGPTTALPMTGEVMLSPAEEIPIRGIRRLIFQNMHLSLSSQAQLTLQTEVSARELIALREHLNKRHQAKGIRISYNAILVRIIAEALKIHPRLNATVDGEKIKVWQQIHIGVAMDIGEGLMVPKIRDANKKSITEISKILDDLLLRAKEHKLLPDEIQGGTFTLTNLGAWDVDHFTPIVNLPESAILGVGRILNKPWVKDGQVVIEPMLALSLTFDHRIIDGAPGAAFLKMIKDLIESPVLLLD